VLARCPVASISNVRQHFSFLHLWHDSHVHGNGDNKWRQWECMRPNSRSDAHLAGSAHIALSLEPFRAQSLSHTNLEEEDECGGILWQALAKHLATIRRHVSPKG